MYGCTDCTPAFLDIIISSEIWILELKLKVFTVFSLYNWRYGWKITKKFYISKFVFDVIYVLSLKLLHFKGISMK